MNRVPVTSSNLKSIGYDADTQTLEIEFKSGGIWDYAKVPPERHAALMEADADEMQSVGCHYHQFIKGKYEGTRVDKEQAA